MASKKMIEALNSQINAELYSSYLYLSMAAYFEDLNLDGFATWTKFQAKEEVEHAMKFYGYVGDVGSRVILDAIDKPPAEFASPLAVFEEILAHEQKVTKAVHDLKKLAIDEADYATDGFLQWFVAEQVEEEATAAKIVEKLKLVGDSPQGLLMLDRQLAMRGQH